MTSVGAESSVLTRLSSQRKVTVTSPPTVISILAAPEGNKASTCVFQSFRSVSANVVPVIDAAVLVKSVFHALDAVTAVVRSVRSLSIRSSASAVACVFVLVYY